jgi:hypothetical protein
MVCTSGIREKLIRRMLKTFDSNAAADENTGGVTPARPELLAQFCPDGLR